MNNLSVETQEALKRDFLSSLHCALPGKVVSFDPETQTAEIQPAVKAGSLAFPLLTDVPVYFPGPKASAITWPVSAGDECLVILADIDIDAWFASGDPEVPLSARRHSLSDGFAFVGFRSRPNALPAFPDHPSFFGVDPDGKKNVQEAVADPAADGTGISFINSISQDAQGVISPHKQTVRSATNAQSGLMSAADKKKEDEMGMVSFGTCSSAADAQVKVVTLSNTNWQLKTGSVVGVKFTYTNTFSAASGSPISLNVNDTGAKNIYYNTSNLPTGTSSTVFGYANRILYYMYDGTYWVWMGMSAELNDNTIPSAYCSTAAATAAKTASCSGYSLLSKSYIHIIITASNTAASALTLNINGKGAKPIYINGTASSATNYTLPSGSYIAYYSGTYYNFRTDGYMPGPVLAMSLGGSGMTGTGATATIADIATAATDCSITTAQYAYWGKVAMVRLQIKKTTAVTSASTTTNLCTMASGKRPKYNASAQWLWNNGASMSTGGVVQVTGAISAGATLTIVSTYVLA